jgi:hypothetical protein
MHVHRLVSQQTLMGHIMM